jgi:ribosomal protein S18 acetylase RimI-like enzyme
MMPDSLNPLASDLPGALALAAEAVRARALPDEDASQAATSIQRELKSGRLKGGLWIHEGRAVGLAVWDASGPVGADLRLIYLTPPVATPELYRQLLTSAMVAAGPVAFAGPLTDLRNADETDLMTSLGLAPFSRSEMRFPPGATVPTPRAISGVVMRPLRPDDAKSAARVHAAAFHDHFDRYLFVEDPDPERDAEKVMQSLFDGVWGEYLPWASVAAERASRLVGVTIVIRTRGRALIADVSVAPEAQGKGIGGALVVASLAALRARDEATIALAVTEENRRAVRLYERIGFVRALGPERRWFNPRAIPARPETE